MKKCNILLTTLATVPSLVLLFTQKPELIDAKYWEYLLGVTNNVIQTRPTPIIKPNIKLADRDRNDTISKELDREAEEYYQQAIHGLQDIDNNESSDNKYISVQSHRLGNTWVNITYSNDSNKSSYTDVIIKADGTKYSIKGRVIGVNDITHVPMRNNKLFINDELVDTLPIHIEVDDNVTIRWIDVKSASLEYRLKDILL